MFTLEVENQYKLKLKLTQNEENYQLVKVDGLTPPKSTITTSKIANYDGSRFKESKLDERNLVLQIKVNGDVEKNRIRLYDFFNVGQPCRIHYRNGIRNVYCDGYCENVESDLFTQNQTIQVSIICCDPYWKNLIASKTDISQKFELFEFPFALNEDGDIVEEFIENREVQVINSSESSVGVIITLTALVDGIINPIIYNVRTAEFMKINDTLNSNERVIIDTNKGRKSIIKIVNGAEINVLHLLDNESKWFQLEQGINMFTYSADYYQSNLKVEFEHETTYKGV